MNRENDDFVRISVEMCYLQNLTMGLAFSAMATRSSLAALRAGAVDPAWGATKAVAVAKVAERASIDFMFIYLTINNSKERRKQHIE
mmetsp:Transcript_35139/g.81249  ORF Transcript_35139/g.81249 Transcript_35139/m.81249 type:complete len:87 (+) Transcript_35139:910-1170(+)